MCDSYEKCRKIVDAIVFNPENKPFTLEQINAALDEAGAIKRYMMMIPPKYVIDALCEQGVLIFSPKDDSYNRVDDWEEKIQQIDYDKILYH